MPLSLPLRTGLLLAAVPAMALAAPAAQAAGFDHPVASPYVQETYAKKHRHRDRYEDYRYGSRYRDGYRRDRYDDRYDRYDRVHRDTRVWRGRDGRYYCQKDNGTTGLLIGGAVGGLIGNEVARDRTLGAILGAAGGALLGREIDRGNSRCR